MPHTCKGDKTTQGGVEGETARLGTLVAYEQLRPRHQRSFKGTASRLVKWLTYNSTLAFTMITCASLTHSMWNLAVGLETASHKRV